MRVISDIYTGSNPVTPTKTNSCMEKQKVVKTLDFTGFQPLFYIAFTTLRCCTNGIFLTFFVMEFVMKFVMKKDSCSACQMPPAVLFLSAWNGGKQFS